jgi:hypothetical protein
MKRALLGFVAFGVLLFGVLQLAIADSRSITDSDSDATPNSLDIVSATAGHEDGKLRHTVTTDAPLNKDSDAQVLLQIDFEGSSKCERELIWPPSGSSRVIHCGLGPTSKRGTISHPSPRTLKFVFSKNAVDVTDKYGWRVITRKCPESCPIVDSAPNQDGNRVVYIRHRLG